MWLTWKLARVQVLQIIYQAKEFSQQMWWRWSISWCNSVFPPLVTDLPRGLHPQTPQQWSWSHFQSHTGGTAFHIHLYHRLPASHEQKCSQVRNTEQLPLTAAHSTRSDALQSPRWLKRVSRLSHLAASPHFCVCAKVLVSNRQPHPGGCDTEEGPATSADKLLGKDGTSFL